MLRAISDRFLGEIREMTTLETDALKVIQLEMGAKVLVYLNTN